MAPARTGVARCSGKSPPKRKEPQQTKPKGDKCEFAPTSRATCQTCKKKILKGQERVGKEEYYESKEIYVHRYYHVPCFERQFPGKSPKLASKRSIQDEFQHERNKHVQTLQLLQQRADLRASLQLLRRIFAQRLNRMLSDFCIFPDATINDIVVKMPRNKADLLKVHGIAEKKYQSFGSAILQVVEYYRQLYQTRGVQQPATIASLAASLPTTTVASATRNAITQRQGVEDSAMDATTDSKTPAVATSNRGKATSSTRPTDTTSQTKGRLQDDDGYREEEIGDEDANNLVVMGKTLSCEEIVQRKFEHAAANNYIISVD
jgi:HRDC domain/Poly(ADP-ribose) polymerase and DNA-Ligase Zn-finger region